MPDPTPATSIRFTRAASAESNRLSRQLARMAAKREEHEQAMEELEREMKVVEERIQLLGKLAGEDGVSASQLRAAGTPGKIILRGATIREVAVPLLLQEAGENPMHYRRWYELLENAGYEVLGQRPDAVFLNQVTRSPLVKSSTQPGIYSIDLEGVDRLRAALEEEENRLADADTGAADDESDFEASAERHRELVNSVGRLRRQLEEVERALQAADTGQLAEAA